MTSTDAHLIPQPPENTGDKNVSAISVTFWRVCQLGEVFCSLCLAGKSHPPPPFPDPVNDWSHAVTAGTIIYSHSALVIKGCEGAPREKEFVQKECLWKWIYLRFSAPWELTQRRFCCSPLICIEIQERQDLNGRQAQQFPFSKFHIVKGE